MDFKGKIVLVTGSTDGIGKRTAVELARLGGQVIIHGRDPEKTKSTLEEIRAATKNDRLDHYSADLSSLEDIRLLSEMIHTKYKSLDILINNAGVFQKSRCLSKDGFELTLAINHLAYFLLTYLLFDLIKKSNYARIINVASMAHSSSVDFDNLQGERNYDGFEAYSLSKLCNIMFTYDLAEILRETHITVNSLHPGVISTKLLHVSWGLGGLAVSKGAATPVYLATSKDVKSISGKYFSDKRIRASSAVTMDKKIRNRIWQLSEEMTGISYKNLEI